MRSETRADALGRTRARAKNLTTLVPVQKRREDSCIEIGLVVRFPRREVRDEKGGNYVSDAQTTEKTDGDVEAHQYTEGQTTEQTSERASDDPDVEAHQYTEGQTSE